MKKVEPHFEEGGKFAKLHPLYDGFATLAFTPGHTNKKGVHVRDGIDLKRTMFLVIVALLPCLIFGMWNTGHQHYLAMGEAQATSHIDKLLYGLWILAPLLLVSYGVGLAVEFAFCIIKKHSIQEGFLVSGMLIPLIMPADVPLWMVAVGTIFAVIIGKEVFGGTGMNILNVALTMRAFLFFAYPTKMSGDKVWVPVEEGKAVDGFSGATPLGDAASTIEANNQMIAAKEAGDVDLANKAQAKIDGALDRLPELDQMLMGDYMGSIGETSVYAIGIGALILLFTGIGSWRVMFSMILGGLTMGWIFNAAAVNPFMEIPAHEQILIGGFMFGTVFMATDPVTAAQTNTGKWIYGFFSGFFAIMIRVFNPAYPEGVMMAILFMNVMAPLIDHYVIAANIKRRMKRAKLAVA